MASPGYVVASINIKAILSCLVNREFPGKHLGSSHWAHSRHRGNGGLSLRNRIELQCLGRLVEESFPVIVPQDSISLAGDDHRDGSLGVELHQTVRQAHNVKVSVLELAGSILVVIGLHLKCLACVVCRVPLDRVRLDKPGAACAGSGDGRTANGGLVKHPGAGRFLEQERTVLAVICKGLGRFVKHHGHSGHLYGYGRDVLLLFKSRGCNFLGEDKLFYIVGRFTHHLDAYGIVRQRGYQKVSL